MTESYADDFNNEFTELLEEQSPYIPKPIIVSYSELSKWDTCRRQWYYRFGLGYQPTQESSALSTGVKGHKLLQTFYTSIQEGYTKEEALAATKAKAVKILEENKLDFDLIRAWTMVENYIVSLDILPNAALVENRFLFPASVLDSDPALDDVQIGFTPDVVFKRKGGFYTVEDAKFVQRAWDQGKLDKFPQAKLYQIFLRKMGYNVSQSAIRFFNTKTAKITEKPYTLGITEERILIENFMDGVKELVRHKKRPPEVLKFTRTTMNYTACQFCKFTFPCTLDAEGKDSTRTLEAQYVKSNYDYST